MPKKKLIVANWKMNEPNLRRWRGFRAPRGTEVVICPPFTQLLNVRKQMSGVKDGSVKLGAQDCFWENPPAGGGAYTGEVSPQMLKALGVKYAIIGHSERRRWLGETDEMIAKKIKAALRAGLKAILCVGEPLSVRRRGPAAAERFVANQLRKDMKGIGGGVSGIVVAYEPVWAVGTGKVDEPEDAAKMSKFIKRFCASRFAARRLPVLYGGSVTSKNEAGFLRHKEIDGALVGGASLNPVVFGDIVFYNAATPTKSRRAKRRLR